MNSLSRWQIVCALIVAQTWDYSLGLETVINNLENYPNAYHLLTVSGFSSGASMATQVHVSLSSKVHGVAMFAGVFYRCGQGFRNKTLCWTLQTFPVDSINDAIKYESEGLIDLTENMKNNRIFVWLGALDEGKPALRSRLHVATFYQSFISQPENIFFKIQGAYHLLPTNSVKNPCTSSASPLYLGNCNYSGSYEALKFILAPHRIISIPEDNIELQNLQMFNQSEFFGDFTGDFLSLDDIGYFYEPKACKRHIQNFQCLIHLFFHGCGIQREIVNSTFIEKSGFLEVAEANNIIMIFPQAKSNMRNPYGCWDYEGYTGENYANKNGPQIQVIEKIIDRVRGHSTQLLPKGVSSATANVYKNIQTFTICIIISFTLVLIQSSVTN